MMIITIIIMIIGHYMIIHVCFNIFRRVFWPSARQVGAESAMNILKELEDHAAGIHWIQMTTDCKVIWRPWLHCLSFLQKLKIARMPRKKVCMCIPSFLTPCKHNHPTLKKWKFSHVYLNLEFDSFKTYPDVSGSIHPLGPNQLVGGLLRWDESIRASDPCQAFQIQPPSFCARVSYHSEAWMPWNSGLGETWGGRWENTKSGRWISYGYFQQ